ncbi:MAG: aminotransferase class I/II-fold pyridoxal phosphate-dependent enzyme, partial [Flavobacterium sp.]
MKTETVAIHAQNIVKSATGDVTMPISLSTTFLRDETGGYPGGHMYSRVSNPNRAALEEVISQLEFGEVTCAFSSGNTAGMTVFQALKAGSHIIAPDDMYWGLKKQLLTIFNDVLTFDFVDLTELDKVAAFINSNTAMIWAETPSNPLLKITDIEELGKIAKTNNLIFVVDSTFSSPILQNPILLGADIVMH